MVFTPHDPQNHSSLGLSPHTYYHPFDLPQVILGAAAVMSNGTVMGRAGTAAVAMVAHSYSKPVLVCCESYKFHERVQVRLL